MKSLVAAFAIVLVTSPLFAGCTAQSEESEPQPDDVGDTAEQPLAVVDNGTTIQYSSRFRTNADGTYGNPYEMRWRYPGGAWNAGDWMPTSPRSLVGIRGAHPTTFFGVPQMEVFNDSNASSHTGTYYLHWSCVDGSGTRKGWQITRSFTLARAFSYFSYTLTCPKSSGTVYYVEGTLTVD